MPSESAPVTQRQISIRDVLWTMTALAMVLAYARTQGEQVPQQAIIYLLMALVAGTVVGGLFGQFKNAAYWSALITLLAFLAVAGGRLPNAWVMVGWGAVGSGCGAFAGATASVPQAKSLWKGSLASGLLGLSLMFGTLWLSRQPISNLLLFDVGCAAGIGLLLWPAIGYLRDFQSRSGLSPVLLAAWLSLSVALGNFLVPVLAGVAR